MTRAEGIGIVAAATLLALLLAIRFDAPWRYIHDDNGAWTQAMATAHLRAGFEATGGQGAMVRRADGGLDRYLHHPPLYPLIVAATYRVTGRSDPAVTRAVSAFFHVGVGFAAMVVLAFTLFPNSPARRLLALALYALVPMSAYFGKMANSEPLGLAWVIAALAATCLHRRHGGRFALGFAALFWMLAVLTSWGALAVAIGIVALFGLEGWRERRPERRAAAIVLGATIVVAAIVVLVQIRVLEGRSSSLFAAGGHWTMAQMSVREALRALGTVIDFHRAYFANVPFALFLVWGIVRIRDVLAGRTLHESQRVLLAGSLGLALYALVFLRALAIHAYGQFWFLPFEAFAAADAIVAGWRALQRRPGLRAALAGVALVGTLASTIYLLGYRYSRSHGYAVRASRSIAELYYTSP